VKSRCASRFPGLDHGLGDARFDQRDLAGHVRRGKGGALPWPGMVERTRDDHVNAVFARGAQRELLLRELADRIGLEGAIGLSSVNAAVDAAYTVADPGTTTRHASPPGAARRRDDGSQARSRTAE
jgi:hypothetical protein